jgi:hypothetical protein
MLNRNWIAAAVFLFAAIVQMHAQADQAHPVGETLTAQQAKQLERSAKTAADHERLAAYYQSQLQQAQKNLADAQKLEEQWGATERASKTPDPYPHARRLVREYSDQVAKYSKLAANQSKIGEAMEAANAAGSKSGEGKQETVAPKQDAQGPGFGPVK